MIARWMTVEHAGEWTGLTEDFFLSHMRDGLWIEGEVWKWVQGRKLIDLQAFYTWADTQPSIPSRRGRKKKGETGMPTSCSSDANKETGP